MRQILKPILANVENALQSADLNNFIEDAVTYTTRADWSKGWETVEGIDSYRRNAKRTYQHTYELSENGEGLEWGTEGALKVVTLLPQMRMEIIQE